MTFSSLSTLCSSSSSSLHPNSKPIHTLSAKLFSKANISVQFLGKKQYLLLSSTPRFRTVIAMARPKPGGIAKKVVGLVKLNLEAGKATKTKTPEAGNSTKTKTPLVGPALGSKGVNLDAFCKEYNARTADKVGYIIPVEITIFDDRSYTFILKTPPTSFLLLKAAGLEKGSKDPKLAKVGTITKDQLQTIAQEKLPDLNCTTIESAMRVIAGTAANMGIDIDPPVLEPKKKAVLL